MTLLLALLLAPPAGPPPDLVSIYELAQSAAPEIAAEALLRLAADPRWPADLKTPALTEAFEKAALAREPYPVVLAYARTANGPAFWRASGLHLGLDRLTLQSRAVMALASAAPPLARRLFDQIPYPELKPLSCQDELVPAPGRYFLAASAVAANSFTAEERRKEAHLTFLMSMLGRVRSVVELAPVYAMIRDAGVTTDQRTMLTTQFLTLLTAVTSDDRCFTTTLSDTWRTVKDAVPPAQFKAFVERHLKQPRCRDTVEDDVLSYEMRVSYGLRDRIEPEKVLDAPRAPERTESAAYTELARRAHDLQRDLRRGSAEWRIEVDAALDAVDRLPSSGDEPARTLRDKVSLMLPLLAAMSATDARDRGVLRLATMLGADPLQQDQFLAWLASADYAARMSVTANPYMHVALLEALERTAPPSLALWARLERLMPRSGVTP